MSVSAVLWCRVVLSALTSSKDECVNMSSWPMVMRGAMTEVGGVMGVMAGDGPSDSSTSLSGLSSETSSVASAGRKPGSTVSSPVVLQNSRLGNSEAARGCLYFLNMISQPGFSQT